MLLISYWPSLVHCSEGQKHAHTQMRSMISAVHKPKFVSVKSGLRVASYYTLLERYFQSLPIVKSWRTTRMYGTDDWEIIGDGCSA